MKQYLLSVVGILIAFVALDYVVHGVILMQAYQDTASLWRPEPEMNYWLTQLPSLITALCFVGIYDRLITRKSFHAAITFGVLWGIAAGAGMSIVCYAVMPIPVSMAATWFANALVQAVVGGAIMGWVYGNRGDSSAS